MTQFTHLEQVHYGTHWYPYPESSHYEMVRGQINENYFV